MGILTILDNRYDSKNNPTLGFKGKFRHFGWGDKKHFYVNMIVKCHPKMDKNLADIG